MLIDYSKVIANDYRDNNCIAGQLRICLEDEGFDVFLVSQREIAKARGGMTWLSKSTGLSRESLYRSLSQGARPEFETIYCVIKALGLTLDFTPAIRKRIEAVTTRFESARH